MPIGLVVQAVVPLPGGVGASEFGFGKLFGWFGCPEPNGVLGSLVQRVVVWTIGLLGYLIVIATADKPAGRNRGIRGANAAARTAIRLDLPLFRAIP